MARKTLLKMKIFHFAYLCLVTFGQSSSAGSSDHHEDLEEEYFYENEVSNPTNTHRNNFGPFLDPAFKPEVGSLPQNNLRLTTDYTVRLETIRTKIRQQIPYAIKSVEKDIREANVNRVVLAVSNFLGAWFGILLGLNGVFTLSTVPPGPKTQALAQAMYGYGYVTPFSFEYEANRLSCGIKDFDEALEEYSFLDNPDPETPVALLTYYTTKLNHAFKRKVSCITNKQGSNDEARVLNGLMDLYTQLQQEALSQ